MGIARGPNVINDGLIFGYDIGHGIADNTTATRFYPGEPTTNVVTNSLPTTGWNTANAQGSSITRTFLTENEIPFMRFSGVTNGQDYPRVTDTAFANSVTVTGSFSTSLEVRGTAGASLNLRIYQNGSTKITNNITLTTEWTRYTFDNQSTGFNLNQPYFNCQTSNAIYDVRNIQIESNSHSTPFVNGSRSDTAGLIDLKRTRNIDLSNSSFTSTGQPTFDGSSDSISLGDDAAFDFVTGVATIEAVVKFPSSWTGGSQYPNLISKGGSAGWDTAGWALYGFRDWPSGTSTKSWGFAMRNGSTVRNVARNGVATDKYVHIVATMDDTTIRLYENGVAQGTTSQTINPEANTSNVYIGRGPSSQYFPGDIPVVKIYDRALTAAEIKQNYNSYKNRFNL